MIEVDAATGVVDIMNVTLVPPAAMVTLAGIAATAVSLLASPITVPPAGAAALNVTVPIDEVPPVTVVGVKPSNPSVRSAFTVSDAARVTPL